MRVFVTGATGFIGMAVVRELIEAGHAVTGLARSGDSARSLQDIGANAHIGSIEDLDGLRRGAMAAEAAIHLAFFHELSHMSLKNRVGVLLGGSPGRIVARFTETAVAAEAKAINTLGSALNGNDRALVAAFPAMALPLGLLATEETPSDPSAPGGGRRASESAILSLAKRGVRASLVCLPPCVHDELRAGLATRMIEIAKRKKVSAYIDHGDNHWPAVHKVDAARLFRTALEQGEAGKRYHAVAEQGIRMKDIAECIGRRLDVPTASISREAAEKHFGWLSPFIAADSRVSSSLTKQRLGWTTTKPSLMHDLCGPPIYRISGDE